MGSPMMDPSMMDPNAATHQCPTCYKVFVSTKGLQQHSIIHTDRKPFNCEICGKPFRFKSNLFEHRSIHTGDQPYVCPFCGKTCRLKGNLKKHLKTHVKEPEELDRAYEAVTGTHNLNIDDAEYYDDQDLENTPRLGHRRGDRRRSAFGRRSGKNKMILMLRQHGDESDGYPMALSDYPPLNEMMGDNYTMLDFGRAALNLSVERFECRLCELMFGSRGEMRLHAETAHNKSSPDSGYMWCDICLRPFDDPHAAELHATYHKRVRMLVQTGEIVLNDNMLPVRY